MFVVHIQRIGANERWEGGGLVVGKVDGAYRCAAGTGRCAMWGLWGPVDLIWRGETPDSHMTTFLKRKFYEKSVGINMEKSWKIVEKLQSFWNVHKSDKEIQEIQGNSQKIRRNQEKSGKNGGKNGQVEIGLQMVLLDLCHTRAWDWLSCASQEEIQVNM